MNIDELYSYNLADAVKFNDKLNPKIWGSDEKMLPQVHRALMDIARDFKEFLGVTDLELKDITVSGSNAAYTYTPHSDIDLHLVVDLPKADESEVYRELFDAKKFQYNQIHNIKIGGYDVELYVQNANEPAVSQGVYSLLNNDWIDVPKRKKAQVDDDSTRSKYEDLAARIDQAVDSGDYDAIASLLTKIREMRASGLAATGEFGPENLAFKILRTQGYIKKLVDARNAAKDRLLSLNERRKKKKKARVRYGFGGYWYPGTAYAGQDHPAGTEGSGGDAGGGGESINEGAEHPEAIINRFAKSCAKLLGLKNTPRIHLHHDVNWTKENGTFGRFTTGPETTIELAASGRHIVDILRTLAHEMTHARQNEQTELPADAGETGSPFEDEANAMAGRIMRHWADQEPDMFAGVELKEGFDQPYPFKWEKTDYGDYDALATLPDGSPLNVMFNQEEDVNGLAYHVEFYRNDSQEVTGEGDAQRIFATVLTAIKQFVSKVKPERIVFSAAKDQDPTGSRAKLYDRLVDRYARSLGYDVDISSSSDKVNYELFKQGKINESSGYIPTDAEKNDPRFLMALSPDVRPGAIGKNANKLKLHTGAQGEPTLLMKGLKNALREFKETGILNVKTLTPRQLAQKHGVSLDQIQQQLLQGIKVEQEHTSDLATAREIALDHLAEFPDYYDRLKKAETDESELFEIKMSPGNLRQEANKIAALAGMEFEMIVPNTNAGDDVEFEPDWSYDERARNFGQVEDFFYDRDYNSSRDVERLMERLNERFTEWTMEQISEEWDSDAYSFVSDYVLEHGLFDSDSESDKAAEEIKDANPDLDPESYDFEQLVEQRVSELLNDFVETEISDQGRIFSDAYDQYVEEKIGEYEDGDFLRAEYPTMSDILNGFDIQWPYYTSPDEGEADVGAIAEEFGRAIGTEVNWSQNYHGAKREPNKYVVEPDGSLDPDEPSDAGLEFISPPLPLDRMLQDLNKVKAWADKMGNYTNQSTGLHINVSVPDLSTAKLDYVKLALMLGDQYVLKQFNRLGNSYAKSAMDIIKERVAQRPEDAAALLDKMKQKLDVLATKIIHSGETNKYTSINTKGGYVEFRSPGGDWLNDDFFKKIEPTLLRFIVALDAALDPNKYREEYLKKLYQLLEPKSNTDTLSYFAKFAAGEIPRSALKSFIKQAQIERQAGKKPIVKDFEPASLKVRSDTLPWFGIKRKTTGEVVHIFQSPNNEAVQQALGFMRMQGWNSDEYEVVSAGNPTRAQQTFSGEWNLLIDGQPVFRVRGETQGIANAAAREWLSQRSPEFRQEHQGGEVTVVPIYR